MKLAAGLALGLMLAGAAQAAVAPSEIEARYTPQYNACLDNPEGASTAGMIACIEAELKVQDAGLNAAYKSAMAKLTADQKTGLQAAQRAWVPFRDADCGSLYHPDWGTLSRVNAASCVLDRTIERTIELERYPDGTTAD